MPVRSNLVCFLVALAGGALWMLSCGSSSPAHRLTVHLPQHKNTRVLHVDTCISGASANEVYVNEQGIGKTSLCPAADHAVDIEVVEGDRRYRVASEQVQIRRTGDGIATSVEAQITD